MGSESGMTLIDFDNELGRQSRFNGGTFAIYCTITYVSYTMSYTSIRVTYVILCNYMLYSYIIIYYNKIVISVSNMFNENTIVQGFDFVARS